MGKENILTILLMDCKIMMLDRKGVKTMKVIQVFQSSFCMSNLKIGHQKNMRLEGITCLTPINLWLFKIYSVIFLNEFLI